MTDRKPGAPGQYKITITAAELQKLLANEEFTATLVRDDQPLTVGTPYSKAAVLPDELAAAICPDVEDPTPADAFSGLLPKKGGTMSGPITMGDNKITGLGTPTADGDGVNLGYVNENFAPAGYGLGTEATQIITSVAALDNLKTGGWYHLNKPGTTIANVPLNHASISVHPYAWGNCVQELRPLNSNIVLTRHFYSDVWSEWEVENPPMVTGTEYRTTERWNGKPVYIQAINVGAFSPTAKTLTAVDGAIENIDKIIAYGGTAYHGTSNSLTMPYHSTSAHLYLFANKTGIAIWSDTAGYQSYTVTAWVKYTKTTD